MADTESRLKSLESRMKAVEAVQAKQKGISCKGGVSIEDLSPFSAKGWILSLANSLTCVYSSLVSARALLLSTTTDTAIVKTPIVNGYLCSAIVMIQSILDSTVGLCQKICPDPEFKQAYKFIEYPFQLSIFRRLYVIKHTIRSTTFNGKTYHDLANDVKHEIPHIANISFDSQKLGYDLYSNDDTPKRGLYYDVLAPVYMQTRELLQKLASIENMELDSIKPL